MRHIILPSFLYYPRKHPCLFYGNHIILILSMPFSYYPVLSYIILLDPCSCSTLFILSILTIFILSILTVLSVLSILSVFMLSHIIHSEHPCSCVRRKHDTYVRASRRAYYPKALVWGTHVHASAVYIILILSLFHVTCLRLFTRSDSTTQSVSTKQYPWDGTSPQVHVILCLETSMRSPFVVQVQRNQGCACSYQQHHSNL